MYGFMASLFAKRHGIQPFRFMKETDMAVCGMAISRANSNVKSLIDLVLGRLQSSGIILKFHSKYASIKGKFGYMFV